MVTREISRRNQISLTGSTSLRHKVWAGMILLAVVGQKGQFALFLFKHTYAHLETQELQTMWPFPVFTRPKNLCRESVTKEFGKVVRVIHRMGTTFLSLYYSNPTFYIFPFLMRSSSSSSSSVVQ